MPRSPTIWLFDARAMSVFGSPQASWAAAMMSTRPVKLLPTPGTPAWRLGTEMAWVPSATSTDPASRSSTLSLVARAARSFGEMLSTSPRRTCPIPPALPRNTRSVVTAAA